MQSKRDSTQHQGVASINASVAPSSSSSSHHLGRHDDAAPNRRAVSLAAAAAVQKFVSLVSLDVNMDHTRQLQLRNKQLTALPPQLGILLRQVCKLDLSGNDLTELHPLNTLPQLSNLIVSLNPHLHSLSGLQCKRLTVLTVSGCGLRSLDGLQSSAGSLRTLIANDNNLVLESPTECAANNTQRLGSFGAQKSAGSESGPRTCKDTQSKGSHKTSTDQSSRAKKGRRKDASVREESGESGTAAAAVDWATARKEWSMYQLNYAVLATLRECETIVLSRNPRLCERYTRASPADEVASTDTPAREGNSKSSSSVSEPEAQSKQLPAYSMLEADRHPLSVFSKLPRLKKLSLTACGVSTLPVRWFLPMVTELRLAHNALTSLQPEGVITRSLKILDVSHNQLNTITTLRRCRFIQQIHLSGNPLVAEYARRDADDDGNADKGAESVKDDKESAADRVKQNTGTTATCAEHEANAHAAKPSATKAATHKVPRALQRALKRMLSNLLTVDGEPLLPDEVLRKRRRAHVDRAEVVDRTARSTHHNQGDAYPDEEGKNDADANDGCYATTSCNTDPCIKDTTMSLQGSEPVRRVASPNAARSARTRQEESATHAGATAGKLHSQRCDSVQAQNVSLQSSSSLTTRTDEARARVISEADDVVMEVPESVAKAIHAPVIRRVRPLQRTNVGNRHSLAPTLTGSEAVKALLQQKHNALSSW